MEDKTPTLEHLFYKSRTTETRSRDGTTVKFINSNDSPQIESYNRLERETDSVTSDFFDCSTY